MIKKFSQENHCLSKKQVSMILESVCNSHEKKLPLNRHCTINLEQMCPDHYKKLLDRFLNGYRNYCTSRNVEPTYLWVLENKTVGVHAHVLFHYPPTETRSIFDLKKKITKKWFNGMNYVTKQKPENWVKIESIRGSSLCSNSQILRQKLDQLHSLIMSLKEDESTSRIAETVISTTRFRPWEETVYDSTIRLTAYLCKGSVRYSQGLISGRRIARSHNLMS